MRWFTIPLPKQYDLDETRTVRLGEGWRVEAPPALRGLADLYRDRLALSDGPAKGRITLSIDAQPPESYTLAMAEDEIAVAGGSEAALRYALYTLYQMTPYGQLPAGRIADAPLLSMRGYHLNLNSLRRLGMDGLLQMIRWAAEAKLNTLLIEYDDCFPLLKYPDSCAPNALTPEEVAKLVGTAQSYGLECIPLVQTCGHLERILDNPALAHIREVPDRFAQLCPRNPEALAFVLDMLEAYLAAHPGLRYLHVGGDETRQLGHCPVCREYAAQYGKGRLYADFMNQIIAFLCDRGVTPLLYDDMICAHPEAMEVLDRRAVIVYWDYWATSMEPPQLIARYDRKGGPVTVCDRRWKDGTWAGACDDLEQGVLDHFAQGIDMERDLSPEFLARYGAYLGPNFPKRVRAFPYMEYYMDQGFRVIGMPTSLGNTDNFRGMPNQSRFIANIETCCKRCAQAGAVGVITSAWYPFPETLFPAGISTTGQFSWGLPDWYRIRPVNGVNEG